MGLAASQARFLAITSRKAYCEFQSMQIAQDKLSITRDLSEISEDYQNALNQTKLVWDYDGSGQNTYNLSYGVLMTPSTLNNYNPYLITTRTGSVVLNNQFAGAAATISPNGSPVNASEAGYKTFINALADNGVISDNTSDVILKTNESGNLIYQYNQNAGYGAEPLNKNGALVKNLAGLAYELQDEKLGIYTEGYFSQSKTVAEKHKVMVNGNFASDAEIDDLTFEDLLTSEVIYLYTGADGTDITLGSNDGDFYNTVWNLSNAMYDKLVNIMGTDALAKQALRNATTLIQQNLLKNTGYPTADEGRSTENAFNSAFSMAQESNLFTMGDAKGSKNNDTVAINLSNLFSCFLTYFELCYNGFDSNYSVGNNLNNSYLVTDDPYYNYVIVNKDFAVDSVVVMQADFYMQLYNNICANGWTANNNIEDNNYLENALKNGTYFISSLNGDGYFYQGRYNEEDCIIEIKDEDAIAQAEAEFTSKKAKLTYKEDQLDIEMKNLDTEISALTTEYDSVKNLISKNVEKVFTLFQ